jgi:hypothetical protein
MLDFAIPFSDPFLLHTIEVFHDPSKDSHASFLDDIKKAIHVVPVTCEGYQCTQCQCTVLRSDSPMEFYEDVHVCEPDIPDIDELDDTLDNDALDDYIDYILDGQYW